MKHMKNWKHRIFLLLALTLLCAFMPGHAMAENSSVSDSNASGNVSDSSQVTTADIIYVNPLYADVLSETDIERSLSAIPQAISETDLESEATFTSQEEVAAYIRRDLVLRNTEVSFTYITDESDYKTVVHGLFALALEETGSPEEGDYLRFQYGGYSCSIQYSVIDGSYHYTLTYTVKYYTTQEEEQQVTSTVSQILSQLDLDGKTPYEKTEALYHYLVTTVTYDNEHLNDDEYTRKYTAYAALIDKTAICQGYAVALYRLLMEADLPCRVIGGVSNSQNHAWNISRLNGYWYNLDSTWDSSSYSSKNGYSWFLLNDQNFSDHTREDQYLTEEFYRFHPMAPENFDPDVPVKCDLSAQEVLLSDSSLPYSGSELTPSVTIAGLTEGVDFEVTYEDNIHPGTAYVTITGIGECTGSITMTTFTITRAENTWTTPLSCADITVGESPKPTAKARFGQVSFAYSSEENGEWASEAPTKPGTWYVQASVPETEDYTGLSSVVSFQIKPGKLTGVSATGYSGYYDGRAHSITVTAPSGTTLTWATSKDGSYTSKKPSYKQPGKYTIYYKASKDGYTPVTGSATVKIMLTRPSVSLSNSATGITIKWSKVNGAAGYYLYQKTSNGWKRIKTITSGTTTSWTHTKRTNGAKYTYTVKAYYKKTCSTYISGKTIYRVVRPTISSLKNSAAKKMTVKWNRNSKASGYQIQYSTSSKFSKAKTVTIAGSKTLTRTFSSLTKGKRYYVRVRAFKTVSGTRYYSSWSASKNVKISK